MGKMSWLSLVSGTHYRSENAKRIHLQWGTIAHTAYRCAGIAQGQIGTGVSRAVFRCETNVAMATPE